MTLIHFKLDQSPAMEDKASGRPIKSFSAFEDFAASTADVTGFVLSTKQPETGRRIAGRLRREPQTSIKPIYLMSSLGDRVDDICDGVVGSMEEAYDLAAPISHRIGELDPVIFSDNENIIFRLLGFLYARPNIRFEPCRHWTHPKLYSFPVVEAMLDSEAEAELWLRNLVQRGLLRTARLIDRVRLCPNCEYAHLNFVDTCPNCGSIAIVQQPFLHCFTCGHVALEEDFIKRGLLSCPNCTTRLRHIGADYDRALENFSCSDCRHVFADPEVIAHCQHCGSKSKPAELIPRNVHALELTDRGVIALRTGRLDDVYALLDALANVDPVHFEFFLDWLLNLSRRYAEETFSLIGIRMKNLLELTAKIGRLRVIELMDGFVGRIREIIRSTDISTRSGQQNFWILLPKTDETGCRAALDRIRGIKDYTQQAEGEALEFATVSFSVPPEIPAGESAKLLMARLEGEMH